MPENLKVGEFGREKSRSESFDCLFFGFAFSSFKFLLQQSFSGHLGFSFNQRFFSSFIFGTGAGRDVGTGSSENRWDQFGFILKGGKRGKEVSRGPFIANSIPFSTLNSFHASAVQREVLGGILRTFFCFREANLIFLLSLSLSSPKPH